MKIVVIGATGNIGSALMRELSGEHELVGAARRKPTQLDDPVLASTRWETVDVATGDLDTVLAGADVVVQLAWLFQPTHDPDLTWKANVLGTRRVLDAASRQNVGVVVCSSSIAAYSAAPGTVVDENWATDGPSSAAYSREKAYVERLLDIFERDHAETRVVRIRPAFVFQRSAASEQRRLFAGPFLPGRLIDPRFIPLLPVPRGTKMQTVHAEDLARAFKAAIERPVRGAFNIAADDVLTADDLSTLFSARAVELPPKLVRRALGAAWQLHLVPAPAELFDAFMRIPVMSTRRARDELDWSPRYSALEALEAFLDGLREGAGENLPPLDPNSSGPLRTKEFVSGVGGQP